MPTPTNKFPGFGRIPIEDPRDHDFPIRGLLNIRAATAPRVMIPVPPTSITLRLSWRGNQGSYPICVGAAGEGMLKTTPSKMYITRLNMFGLYQGAQEYDEIPGIGYEGTTARGLFRFLVDFHPARDIKSYWWAFTPEEVQAALASGIPVMLGIDMRREMMNPSVQVGGKLRAYPIMRYKGSVEGGHEMLIVGYARSGELFLVQNSWSGWGVDQRAWFPAEDLKRAFLDQADCGVAVKEPRPEKV